MTDEKDKSAPPSIVTTFDMPSLLGSLPPTAPAVLQAMEDTGLKTRHYAALGQVAAHWAHFEATVDAWLAHFAGVPDEVCVCFTGQMIGPRPRIDAFIALVRHQGVGTHWNKPLEQFAKDAQGLGEMRNRALHDVWDMVEPAKPIRLEVTAKRSVRILEIHEPTDKLLELVGAIAALRTRFLDQIADPIDAELHPSPGISPP